MLNCNYSQLPVIKLLKTKTGIAVFLLTLLFSHFLTPLTVYFNQAAVVAVIFLVTFGLSTTCLFFSLKEQARASIKAGKSLLSVVTSLIGLSAVQFCSVNSVACGSTLGFSFLSSIMPNLLFGLIHRYAILFLLLATSMQLFSLIKLKCLQCNR